MMITEGFSETVFGVAMGSGSRNSRGNENCSGKSGKFTSAAKKFIFELLFIGFAKFTELQRKNFYFMSAKSVKVWEKSGNSQ